MKTVSQLVAVSVPCSVEPMAGRLVVRSVVRWVASLVAHWVVRWDYQRDAKLENN